MRIGKIMLSRNTATRVLLKSVFKLEILSIRSSKYGPTPHFRAENIDVEGSTKWMFLIILGGGDILALVIHNIVR